MEGRGEGRREAAKQTEPSDEQRSSAMVSGFTRNDIPDLIRRAQGYAGRGDYDKAASTFGTVLALDPKNAEAADGMRRVKEAQKMKR
jgi:hypothetical protein